MKNLASKNLSTSQITENLFEKIEYLFDFINVSREFINEENGKNPEEFLCIYCNNLPYQPSMCQTCQRIICLRCKINLFGIDFEKERKIESIYCKNCKNLLFLTEVLQDNKEKLDDLQLKCLGYLNNCKEIIYYRDYLHHLNHCPKVEGLVKCLSCGFIDKNSDIIQHIGNCQNTIMNTQPRNIGKNNDSCEDKLINNDLRNETFANLSNIEERFSKLEENQNLIIANLNNLKQRLDDVDKNVNKYDFILSTLQGNIESFKMQICLKIAEKIDNVDKKNSVIINQLENTCKNLESRFEKEIEKNNELNKDSNKKRLENWMNLDLMQKKLIETDRHIKNHSGENGIFLRIIRLLDDCLKNPQILKMLNEQDKDSLNKFDEAKPLSSQMENLRNLKKTTEFENVELKKLDVSSNTINENSSFSSKNSIFLKRKQLKSNFETNIPQTHVKNEDLNSFQNNQINNKTITGKDHLCVNQSKSPNLSNVKKENNLSEKNLNLKEYNNHSHNIVKVMETKENSINIKNNSSENELKKDPEKLNNELVEIYPQLDKENFLVKKLSTQKKETSNRQSEDEIKTKEIKIKTNQPFENYQSIKKSFNYSITTFKDLFINQEMNQCSETLSSNDLPRCIIKLKIYIEDIPPNEKKLSIFKNIKSDINSIFSFNCPNLQSEGSSLENIIKNQSLLAIGFYDTNIKIFNVYDNNQFIKLKGHSNFINIMTQIKKRNILLSCSEDKTIRAWSIIDGRCLKVFYNGCAAVKNLQQIWNSSSNNSNEISFFTGGDDGEIRLFNFSSDEPINQFNGHKYEISSMLYLKHSNDEIKLATGGFEEIKLWDVESAKLRRTLTGHNSFVNKMIFIKWKKDNFTFASSSYKTIKIWNYELGVCLTSIEANQSEIYCLKQIKFDEYSHIMLSAGYENVIKLWDLESGILLKEIESNSKTITCLEQIFNIEGFFLIFSGKDDVIRVFK